MPQFTAEEIRVVVDEAHTHGLAVTAHAHAVDAIRAALDGGVDSIEHCSFLTEAGIVVDDDVIADLVRTATPVCPTLGFMPGSSPPPRVQEMMRRMKFDPDSRNRMVADVHRAGVRLVSGSDSGISPGKRYGSCGSPSFRSWSAAYRSSMSSLRPRLSVPSSAGWPSARAGCGPASTPTCSCSMVTHWLTALRSVQAVYVRGQRQV